MSRISPDKTYKILMSRKAEKLMSTFDLTVQKRIFEVLDFLTTHPRLGKPLTGSLKGYWSVRAWPFRIIYEIKDRELIVYIVAMGHRKDIYKKR